MRSVGAPLRRPRASPVPTAAVADGDRPFPGFPSLLWQTRSAVTGDPVRVVQVRERERERGERKERERERELQGARFRFPAARVESSRAWPPHRPREEGFTHPADTSRSNLAAALALVVVSKPFP
jgi:hypothetical protein